MIFSVNKQLLKDLELMLEIIQLPFLLASYNSDKKDDARKRV
jgi:hypothetical protein